MVKSIVTEKYFHLLLLVAHLAVEISIAFELKYVAVGYRLCKVHDVVLLLDVLGKHRKRLDDRRAEDAENRLMRFLVVLVDLIVTNRVEFKVTAGTAERDVLPFMLDLVRVIAKGIVGAESAELVAMVDRPVNCDFKLQ